MSNDRFRTHQSYTERIHDNLQQTVSNIVVGTGVIPGCGLTGPGTSSMPIELKREVGMTGPALGPLPADGFLRDKIIANDPCNPVPHSTNFQLLIPDSSSGVPGPQTGHGIVMGGGNQTFANDGTLPNCSILSGDFNSITDSIASTICGGGGPAFFGNVGNSITSCSGTSIGGGTRNNITNGSSHRIGGGANNTIDSISGDSGIFIGGGSSNIVDGITNNFTVSNCTICGGSNNVVRPTTQIGTHAFIGGGQNNECRFTGNPAVGAAYNSCIVGGRQNICDAPHSTIGGGDMNVIDASLEPATNQRHCTISGGAANTCSGIMSTIGGGGDNEAVSFSVVCGGGGNPGSGNSALGSVSAILGGQNNGTAITGSFAAVLGGSFNNADGTHSVAAGSSATASTSRSMCFSCDSGGGTTTNVGEFQIVLGTDGATPSLVIKNLPSGAGVAPGFLPSGGIWVDTTTLAIPVLRIVP